MEVKPVILVLADISGYTRFIKFHRVSLIHAELIITELLEAVISSSDVPLILHELEGDAVTFYALDQGGKDCATRVFGQVERFFEAFRRREAELVSECGVCNCEACTQVGRLKIKVVLHRGEAAFSTVRRFTKVAGEDVILAHRLLKNSVPSDEYILMTEPFADACEALGGRTLERRVEHADGLGDVPVYVIDLALPDEIRASPSTRWERLKMFARLEGYTVRRLLLSTRKSFKGLEGV
jgi:hypothetical protein